ncbi:MAG: pyridoxamine 5'-phosphate oxidase family protein [Henriciella sp.]|nr:pyridoxamine 5'-phosphate oxidase family protein [Henriciella sp.]
MSNETSAIPPSPSAADYAVEEDRPLIPDVGEPFALLETWLIEARASEPNDSSAMTLATVDADGMPDARIVLLRGASSEGLKFYTNFDSTKAEQLEASGKAALCLHWKSLHRQSGCKSSSFSGGFRRKLPPTGIHSTV